MCCKASSAYRTSQDISNSREQVDAATAALESSGCQPSDTACICSSTAFINAITTTIVKSCSNADVEGTFCPVLLCPTF